MLREPGASAKAEPTPLIETASVLPSDALAMGFRSAKADAPAPAPTLASAAPLASLAPAVSPAEEMIKTALEPRLKPALEAAAMQAPRAALRVSEMSQLVLASAVGPPPIYFDGELFPARSSPPLTVALSRDVSEGPHARAVVLEKGEAFVDALRRAGVRPEDRNAAAYAFGKHYNLRRLRPGQELLLTVAEPNQTLFQLVAAGHDQIDSHLLALDFRSDPLTRISLKRSADGSFSGVKSELSLIPRLVSVSGRIDGSLYLSAKRAGAPDKVIADLANMFAYDVDFQREIVGGDEFEALYEMLYDENGSVVGTGDILYGRLKWRSRTKEKGYYRFAAVEGGRADYFDAAGESAKRLLMKTPIDGARLSSGFGTRKHPILGYQKAHKGVDFAAPRGTPIKAAGSGVVERAGPWSTFGNYVRIRHANGYKTAYAHLNSIRKGIRVGVRVNQGDIIGYVGTTGRSTGPHLHYEVHLHDRPVNPQTLKIAQGVTLRGDELDRFKLMRTRIDAMRLPPEPEPALLARDGAVGEAL
jgi:murein DD-endopeptidase MepM/ murein hydrolase activator NlpD